MTFLGVWQSFLLGVVAIPALGVAMAVLMYLASFVTGGSGPQTGAFAAGCAVGAGLLILLFVLNINRLVTP